MNLNISKKSINYERHKWLFNFSSSHVGGGLTRTLETIKWFDDNSGAYFIINCKIKDMVLDYNKKNIFFFIKENKLMRLIYDGYYMSKIIKKIGQPEIYFSYGIPVFYKVGNINWFHISNSLSLKTKHISLTFLKRVQMWILKKRIIRSMNITDISTGESEFSINLLKKENDKKNLSCFYRVLPNGFDISILDDILNKKRQKLNKYALTIGTYSYKRVDLAVRLFHQIRKKNNLKKFIVIGETDSLPKFILNDNLVEFRSNISREKLFYLLYNSEFYISASQIENSSIAALEALLLSRNIVLSNIPSHNEMLSNLKAKDLILEESNHKFKLLKNINKEFNAASWSDICESLFMIVNDYKKQNVKL